MFKVKIKGLFSFCFPTLTYYSFKYNLNRKAVNMVFTENMQRHIFLRGAAACPRNPES